MPLYRKLSQPGLLYQSIVDEIEQMVVSGQLKPDDSLPAERDLAQRFGVSRTAVREAIKVLSQMQLVAVLRGKGVVVAHPSTATVAAPLGLLFKLGKATRVQLTEVRLGLEPEMAALASLKATSGQATAIQEIAAGYQAVASDPEEATSLDLAFHRSICEAAQNGVATAILASIQELYREAMLPGYTMNGAPARAVYYHNELARAIGERDADAARRYMREHLDHVWNDLMLLEGQRPIARPPGIEEESGYA